MRNEALYAKYHDGRHWDQHPTEYAERFAAFLLARSFKGQLVDLGCGSGRDVAVFHAQGIDALGLDKDAAEIEVAQLKHPDCAFRTGDIELLPFLSRVVHAYYLVNVIHYVDQRQAFREMLRTLEYRGLVFVHFNLQIVDARGKTDLKQSEQVIRRLLEGWTLLARHVFQRVDEQPLPHTHTILELILQKPRP